MKLPDRQTGLNLFKWILVLALGLHLLMIILFFGKPPLWLRWFVFPRAEAGISGMGLAVYDGPSFSGRRQIQRTPGAMARLEKPHTALKAFGVWKIQKSGNYTLIFSCDDYGDFFIDGQPVIQLKGISHENRAHTVVPLSAGPHLLVVHLFNKPERGFFRLEMMRPDQEAPVPLSASELHPLNLGWSWEAFRRGGMWIRTGWFWVLAALLSLLNLGFFGARSLKQGTFNGLLILGGCLVAAWLGEITARLFFPPPQAVFFREKSDLNTKPRRGDNPFIMPTERGYRHRPNTEVTVANHPFAPGGVLTFKTNSIGYRNREIGPKTGTRVLFLGDSITFGLSMPEEYIFVRRVENMARREGLNWETINSAVGGLGLNAELSVLVETGLALQPDMVVLGFYLNDFQESPGIYIASLPGWLNSSRLAHKLVNVYRHHFFLSPHAGLAGGHPMLNTPAGFPEFLEEFQRHSTVLGENSQPDAASRDFHERVVANFNDWGGSFSPRVWDKLETLLKEMNRLAARHRFRLVIIAFPVRDQVEAVHLFDYPQRRLQMIARSLDAPYLDLLPFFRRDNRENPQLSDQLFYDNCHLTIRGHRVTAEVIYPFLKKAFPQE